MKTLAILLTLILTLNPVINIDISNPEKSQGREVVKQNGITYLPYTEDEINLIARVVMSEGSLLSFESKQMIAQTVINRMNSDIFPNTIEEVVYQSNQFSTANNGEPGPECYAAVDSVIINMPFPDDLLYFRESKVQYGYQYAHERNFYFSTLNNYN